MVLSRCRKPPLAQFTPRVALWVYGLGRRKKGRLRRLDGSLKLPHSLDRWPGGYEMLILRTFTSA